MVTAQCGDCSVGDLGVMLGDDPDTAAQYLMCLHTRVSLPIYTHCSLLVTYVTQCLLRTL